MKILFISAMMPYPLHSGGKVRVFQLLKRMSKKHEISLFTFLRTKDETQYKKHLDFCARVQYAYRGKALSFRYIFPSVIGQYPLLYQSYNNSTLRRMILHEIQQAIKNGTPYDLIHVEPGYVWLSIPETNLPIVVAEHNIEHMVYTLYAENTTWKLFKPFLQFDINKMQRMEKIVWDQARAIIAVHDGEKKYIESISKSKVYTVPNGVDTEYFSFQKKIFDDELKFLFVGNFTWIQNTQAVNTLLNEIWPNICKRFPKSTLTIAGAKIPSWLYEKTRSKNEIHVLNDVQHIVTQYHAADIFLAPIAVGGGSRYKLLEALSTGLPVITTPLGATGMQREYMFIAESNEDYIKHILHIMSDSHMHDFLERGRTYVQKQFGWDNIAKSLEEAWHEAGCKSTN